MNPAELLGGAIASTQAVISAIRSEDLPRPTPCVEWDLRALLNHLAGRAVLSERAARGMAVTEFPDAAGDLLGDDAADQLLRLLDASAVAWRNASSFDRMCVTPLGEVPAVALVTFQAQDVFVHGWDIAKTIGMTPDLDSALVETMFALHQHTITDELRAAFFAPIVPVADDATPLDQLVGFLGRRP
jgi:uncharacterized protein (TIGR03086 family)